MATRLYVWILRLSGFRVVAMDEAVSGRLRIRIERRGVPATPAAAGVAARAECSRCETERGTTSRGPHITSR